MEVLREISTHFQCRNNEKYPFNLLNTIVRIGVTHGIFRKHGNNTAIHNRIYQQIIYNWIASKIRQGLSIGTYGYQADYVLPNGQLNMEQVLLKFQQFMKEHHTKKNKAFLEQDGRLVFLAFLKPIINGYGFDFKEPQIAGEMRLDIVVTFMDKKYILELKIWGGEAKHQRGMEQLGNYLQQQNLTEGYLLIFNFNQSKEWKSERLAFDGKKIFAVWT